MPISVDTPLDLLLGAGNLWVDWIDIGATKDGTVFRVEQVLDWPEFNYAKGPVDGTIRKILEVASLQVTLVEMTMENIALAIPCATASSSDAVSTIISGGEPGCIPDACYHDVFWVGENCEGETLRIILRDAIPMENLEVMFQCDKEAAFTIAFMATYDPLHIEDRPWYMLLYTVPGCIIFNRVGIDFYVS